MSESHVYIGCAAGFADERPDAGIKVAETLASYDGPRYLIYETLAERTLALSQLARKKDPAAGYTPQLDEFLRPVLRFCKENSIRIVANFGAANPIAAGRRVIALAQELDLEQLSVGVLEGDDLLQEVGEATIRHWDVIDGIPLRNEEIIAANVYLGARPIAEVLSTGADVVITGRCTDSALALGPLIEEFCWPAEAWDMLGAGTLVGHLLECGPHVTGGYFADPGYKDVPYLADVGYPIAEVSSSGEFVVTKASSTGGLVSARTVKEQLLYELHDPTAYLVPDVTLDISDVTVEETGPDRVLVRGARGRPGPETLKVIVSSDGGWLGEGEISYCGPNALARAQLASAVLRRRLDILHIECPIRIDIIGTVSTFDSDDGVLQSAREYPADGDYRVRLAGTSPDRVVAESIAKEVIRLYSSGPAGGGGVRQKIVQRVRTHSTLVNRSIINSKCHTLSTGVEAGREYD